MPPLTPDRVMAILAETPKRIEAVTADVAPARLHIAPAPGEWSAVEVLAHLRSCADVWGGCIADIAVGGVVALRAVNPRTYAERTDYPTLEFTASFAAFAAQRRELLALLASLDDEQWARRATVTGAGKPLERTPLAYAEWMATHERPHVKQIERTIARV